MDIERFSRRVAVVQGKAAVLRGELAVMRGDGAAASGEDAAVVRGSTASALGWQRVKRARDVPWPANAEGGEENYGTRRRWRRGGTALEEGRGGLAQESMNT